MIKEEIEKQAEEITKREYTNCIEENHTFMDKLNNTEMGNGMKYFCMGVMKGLVEGRKRSNRMARLEEKSE